MPEHAALITVLILDRPVCLDCIAAKANLTVQSVRNYLEQIATAVTLQQWPNEACRTCGNVGHAVAIGRAEIHDIRDGTSDDGLISAVIRDTPLCADCIAKKTGIPPDRVRTVLATLSHTFRVTSGTALCGVCVTAKMVFRLAVN